MRSMNSYYYFISDYISPLKHESILLIMLYGMSDYW